MTNEEYDKAAKFWTDKESSLVIPQKTLLLKEIDNFLTAHNTCVLATGYGDFVRATPIEYTYYKGCLYMFSEGGLKFKALRDNKNVSVAVFDNYGGFANLAGMQITAKAEIIEDTDESYAALLKLKGINPEALKKLDHPMHLLKITPSRIDFLSSEMKKKGFSSRQFIEF